MDVQAFVWDTVAKKVLSVSYVGDYVRTQGHQKGGGAFVRNYN